MSLAISSDLFKLKFLIKYGGVWVDATSYPLIPLDDWLLNKMQARYFFFYKPGRDRLISTWFMAAEKNNTTFIKFYQALLDYWTQNTFRNIGKPWLSYMKWIYKITNRNVATTKLWFSFFYTKVLRVTPYLITHYMFYNMISQNKELNNIFHKMPKFDSKNVHKLKKEDFNQTLCYNIKIIIDHKEVPVLKLNWRYVEKTLIKGSNIEYLFKN